MENLRCVVERITYQNEQNGYFVIKCLGNGLIKGIGPKYAKKIVNRFGKDTLDIIEETPDTIAEKIDVLSMKPLNTVRKKKATEIQVINRVAADHLLEGGWL